LVILTHILVEEVIREGSLISYVLHFSLCDVALAIMMEPIAWSGLLCVLAMRAAALVSIFARVVPRSYHVDAERGSWLATFRVSAFHHVNGGEGLGVDLHGVLVENQTSLFYRHLDLLTPHPAVVGGMGERVMPFAVWLSIQLLYRGEFETFGYLQLLLLE
jgi:hypothetical protein